MRPSLRTAGIWAFSALFGCVSLFGQGWHSLLGEYHGAHLGCSQVSCCPPSRGCHERICHDHGDSADSHDHSHHEHYDDAPALAACLATLDEAGGDGHLCSICSFFAQAQWNFDFQPAELMQVSCELTPVDVPAVWLARLGSYRSRAPPFAAAI